MMTPESKNSEGVTSPATTDDGVLRLAAEELSVSKQQVLTGRVRVSTVTHEREEVVDELLSRDRVEINREPFDKYIPAMPEIRTEGDVTIIPIVEEVIERRLVLKEEIRVRRVRDTERFQDRVTLRNQEAVVTREPPDETTN
jgi:uncharacterized protein (TIGR02271 family)